MELKNLNASYKDKQIYENISIGFDHVGMTFIKGDSGIGKTTLLNILYGLKSFEGEYIVEGEVDEFIRNNMAYIFQDFKIDTNLTVYENIILQLNIKKIKIDDEYINELLDDFDMLGNKNKKAQVLSGGEKQRLAIIRALVTNPSILLCDEPTGNLDEDKSFEIFDLLKEISKTKLVLVVSHTELLIEKYSDVVYEIVDMKLKKVKDSNLNTITYSNESYGKISSENLYRKATSNFKTDLFKKLSIFLVFSFLSSIFIILNFSKEANTDYIANKYSEHEGKDTIYVKLKRKKSFEYFDQFYKEIGFDGYIMDFSVNYYQNLRNPYMVKNNYARYGNLSIMPKFINDEILEKYIDDHLEYYGEKCEEFKFYCFDNLTRGLTELSRSFMVVSNFEVMNNSLLIGRIPLNSREILINENSLIKLINLYNKIILDNNIDEKLLEYKTMTLSDISDFLVSNNIIFGGVESTLNDYYLNNFTLESLYNDTYDVVGVVDDYYFGFDEKIFTDSSGSFDISFDIDLDSFQGIFVSKEMFLNATKRHVKYFNDRLTENDVSLGVKHDVKEVYDDNSLDLTKLDLFPVLTLYKEGLDIYEYSDYVSKLEEHPDVKEVLIDEMYQNYRLDEMNIKRIYKQITIYSILILVVAFFTTYIPYYLMIRNRSKEFMMYRIIGLEKKERLKLYVIELSFVFIVVAVMITVAYFAFSILLEQQLCNVFESLIYSTRVESLNLTFRINEIIVLVLMTVPFVLSYKFLETKRDR